MTVNIGTIDRLARAIFGLTCIVLVFVGPFAATGWPRHALAIVGGILLLTAAVKTCPLYSLLGIKTCPAKKGG